MKKISLRWKLTLLYTLFMTLLTGVVLAVLLYLGGNVLLESASDLLKDRVFDSVDFVKVRNGVLKVDPDFSEAEDGIYLSAYDEAGTLLAGRTPLGIASSVPFQENTEQTAIRKGTVWHIFDASFQIRKYGRIRIRGICSMSAVENEIRLLIKLALVLLPLTVVLSAILCYSLVKRTLRPVFQITRTAGEICEQQDLSRRIGLKGGRDEIAVLAETFDHMLAQLQNAFERQKQFTSDVSHELRTPLAVILSQCDSCLANQGLKVEEKTALEVIRNRTTGLIRLVSQLLLLSRADQKRQPLCFETLDFSMLTQTVMEEQEEIARQKQIFFETKIQENIILQGDETMLFRLWMNLTDNAIAYTQEGGRIEAGLFAGKEGVTGYVKDTGIGISRTDLPKIWERFYRAETARSDTSHSGLGLSMAKWIVEAHEGKIRAESEEGKGSLFTFTLPTRLIVPREKGMTQND